MGSKKEQKKILSENFNCALYLYLSIEQKRKRTINFVSIYTIASSRVFDIYV